MSARVTGVLFDKDGTLFDFGATWNTWAARLIAELAEGDGALEAALAEAVRFDLARGAFHSDSPVIAGTNREAAELLCAVLPGTQVDTLEARMIAAAKDVPLAQAVPLVPLTNTLRAMGLRLGVMTNDTETVARSHLTEAGALAEFDFVAGADSGFGAKPDAAPLLAFAEACGLAPEQIVMVGDSTHDLEAGRAAGMQTVGVLTGPAEAEALAPLADAVLPDIGHLPAWLAGRTPV